MPQIRRFNKTLRDLRVGILLTDEQIALAKRYCQENELADWMTWIESAAAAAIHNRLASIKAESPPEEH